MELYVKKKVGILDLPSNVKAARIQMVRKKCAVVTGVNLNGSLSELLCVLWAQ